MTDPVASPRGRQEPSPTGRHLYFDIESDGLLKAIPSRNIRKMTQIFCIGAIDVETLEEFYWGVDKGPQSIQDGIAFLEGADRLIGHNAEGFDYRALERFGPRGFSRPPQSWDSLILAKLIWPTDLLIGPDMERIKRGQLPANMLKAHSLKAWGYRTGTYKDEYTGGFDAWNQPMADYMMQDCRSGLALWHLILKRLGWRDATPDTYVYPLLPVEIESDTARIIKTQEEDGVRFDAEAAHKLARELRNEQARLESRLVEIFGSWWQPLSPVDTGELPAANRQMKLIGYPDVTFKRISEKTGKELAPYVGPPLLDYTTDAPFVRMERTTFNPSSRDHLGQRLQAVYGWKPKQYGKNGKPTVDESVLTDIPESVMPEEVRTDIMDYFVVSKTLGMVAVGAGSWLRLVEEDGRIHGRVDALGTVTGRATHSKPNISQVPAIKKEKVELPDGSKVEQVLKGLSGKYGYECRALFVPDEGWEQTGVDASSLELICLGHYLWKWDEGVFSGRVCDPTRDPHQEHADIAGGMLRADAKTTIYLLIFGGSAFKLSIDPNFKVRVEEIPEYLTYRGLPALLSNLYKRMGPDFTPLDDIGQAKLAKARITIVKLSEGIEGLKDFMSDVQGVAVRGWLKALDGRKTYIRKAYAAPNSLLQGAGAIICKLWRIILGRKLAAIGLLPGRDYRQMTWSHDEYQFSHRLGLGPTIIKLSNEAIKEAGIQLSLRGELRSEGKTGSNWAETH